jgi:ADP-ribose pyrophosphatase
MAIVFDGRKFQVEVVRRRYPDGREHEVEIVRHPAVVVLIPMAEDGRVVLIKQYRAAIERVQAASSRVRTLIPPPAVNAKRKSAACRVTSSGSATGTRRLASATS